MKVIVLTVSQFLTVSSWHVLLPFSKQHRINCDNVGNVSEYIFSLTVHAWEFTTHQFDFDSHRCHTDGENALPCHHPAQDRLSISNPLVSPFCFLSAFPLLRFVFLYLYLLRFLGVSLWGGCDECEHMCGVYDGLLTGRSYLLCSAPVVLWLRLTAWILDKRADIKEYSGAEQASPSRRSYTHVSAVGGGSDIRRFRWQSQARQVRLRQFCGRLPLGKLWYHISPRTSSCTFSRMEPFFFLFQQKLTASSCSSLWLLCSSCQRAIASVIGILESAGRQV